MERSFILHKKGANLSFPFGVEGIKIHLCQVHVRDTIVEIHEQKRTKKNSRLR